MADEQHATTATVREEEVQGGKENRFEDTFPGICKKGAPPKLKH
jgi:hypothetical protein